MKQDSEILDDFVIGIVEISRMDCDHNDQVQLVTNLLCEDNVNITCAAIALLALLADRKVEKIIN